MPGTQLHVLVVDDDPIILDLMASIAQSVPNGSVTALEDSQKAIELIQSGKKFDLVLTDLMMPDHSGLDILREVLKTNPNSLVTLVTGYGDLEDAIRAIESGAYGYIHKPFRREELALILRNMSEKIELERQIKALQHQLDQQEQFITHLATELQGFRQENQQLRTRWVQSGLEQAGKMGQEPPTPKVTQADRDQQAAQDLADLATLFGERRISDSEFKNVRKKILNRVYGEPTADTEQDPDAKT